MHTVPEGDAAARRTLLVALAHPDDEIGCAGTMALHAALGHRVVMLFLTRGEMTEALGPLGAAEVAARRTEHAHEAAGILGAEARLLDFADTRIEVSADATHQLAREIAVVRPDAVITWGDAWRRGPRHPDHRATGELIRGAITLARITRVVTPLAPHREPAPVYTIREPHSQLPAAAVDIGAHTGTLFELARFYRERVGWPPQPWLEERIGSAGARWGCAAAEEFDAWESPPGLRATLFES
ncbi:MAG TPA: PIG-L family deacetylase [Longimicrobiales bacterium]|nr:PIG-L family deacetylase [Longimicrobiales bacterium]